MTPKLDTQLLTFKARHAQFITTALQYNNQIIWDVWQVQVSLLPQGWWRGLKGDVVNIGDGDVVGL